MKRIYTVVLLLTAFNAFSQDWPVKKLVQASKANHVVFQKMAAFSFVSSAILAKKGTYQQLSLNSVFTKQIMEQQPAAIRLSIPLSSSTSITCELVKFTLGNVVFTSNNTDVIENIKLPVTYRGIITGDTGRNNVMLTVNDDYLSLVATNNDRVLQVTKADETTTSAYRLYNSNQLNSSEAVLSCGTSAMTGSSTSTGIDLSGATKPLGSIDKCVYVFVDCFDSMYIWRDTSTQKTINYVYELFNYVATGYLNEQINIKLTNINIWTKNATYRRDTRENALADLAFQWKDNFWGNICVGLDYGRKLGGLAGGIGTAKGVSVNTCPAFKYSGDDRISACSYSDLNFNGGFVDFPRGPNTTEAQVALVMHEMGHLLGAHHTQWCGWVLFPLILGALDNCVATEGGCPPGQPPPGGKGTIMSYCHLNGLISFKNGFGIQPGNAVRNYIDKNSCFPSCLVCTSFLTKPADKLQSFAWSPGSASSRNGTAKFLTAVKSTKPANQAHLLITNTRR